MNVLDVLRLEKSNPYTIFKSIHWQGFRNIILKDSTIKRIINEIRAWRESGLAAEFNPGEYIDRIMYIRSNAMQATSTYYDLFLKHGRSDILQQGCEIALE